MVEIGHRDGKRKRKERQENTEANSVERLLALAQAAGVESHGLLDIQSQTCQVYRDSDQDMQR